MYFSFFYIENIQRNTFIIKKKVNRKRTIFLEIYILDGFKNAFSENMPRTKKNVLTKILHEN